MPLTFTKRQRALMIETLEEDFETADDAAAAVLATAMKLLAERAKFTVIGYRMRHPGEEISDAELREDRIALEHYATAKQALDAALSLTISTSTHEQFYAAVMPVHYGTPASFFSTRKKARDSETLNGRSTFERELKRRVDWLAEHPDETPPKDWGVIPFSDNEWSECFMCDGLGKLRKTETIEEE